MIEPLGVAPWHTKFPLLERSVWFSVRRSAETSSGARPVVEGLIAAGVFLDRELVNRALASVGDVTLERFVLYTTVGGSFNQPHALQQALIERLPVWNTVSEQLRHKLDHIICS